MQRLHLKIPPPLVAAFVALLIWLSDGVVPEITAAASLRHGAALLFVAAALTIDLSALIIFMRARTTIDPRRPHRTSAMITHGIYRITRNPMYLGLALLLTAFSLWLGNPVGLIGVAVFIFYINRCQIEPEEHHLERLFGEEYRDYKSRVRRWL